MRKTSCRTTSRSISPECIRTLHLFAVTELEMPVFSLWVLVERSDAPASSSPVVRTTASKCPHRARHAYHPRGSSRDLWCVITGEILFTPVLWYRWVCCYLFTRILSLLQMFHISSQWIFFQCSPWRRVGVWSIASIMHNLCTRWRWVIGFAPRLLCPRGKNHCYSSIRRMDSYFFIFLYTVPLFSIFNILFMWLVCHLSSFSPLEYSLSFKDFYKYNANCKKIVYLKSTVNDEQ